MQEYYNEKSEILKKAAKRKLINYCEIIDKKYEAGWHHEVIANILQNALFKVLHGEKVRIILSMPPRHGKSELATIKFPSWALGQCPDIPFIVSAYNGDLAQDFGQKTRDLMQNEIYQTVFKTRLRQDTTAKGRWMTDQNGSYTSVGIGGAITGRGFKFGIVEDPYKNKEEAESELIRNKVWDWWKSTFYTRGEGQTAIIVIMTRWHEDDLVGRLLEQQEKFETDGETNFDKWDVVNFPAIAEEDDKYRKKGEALWPEKYPIATLETIENAIGVVDFEALYQQNPIAGQKLEFKQEYFKYFEEKELPEQFDIDITVDPAISKKKKACNTAIVSVGKSKTIPDWFVLDYKADKYDPGELISNTFEMYLSMRTLYPLANINVWVEGVAYQQSLEYFMQEEMKRRKEYFMVHLFIDSHDKEQRIRGLIPMYKVGVIKHRGWMKELEKEALKFPKGKTLDILDALSFHLHIKPVTRDARKEEKQADPGSLLERIQKINKRNSEKAMQSYF